MDLLSVIGGFRPFVVPFGSFFGFVVFPWPLHCPIAGEREEDQGLSAWEILVVL